MTTDTMKRAGLWLLPIGPLAVAVLRFVLPYYTADGDAATARAVIAHPDRQGVVLWLGLIAVVTLVPGLIAVGELLPQSRLKTWAFTLLIPGYLCLGILVAEDYELWSAVKAQQSPQQIAALLHAAHPSAGLAIAAFVFGHVVGTVLLGIALVRSHRIPGWAGVAVAVSQPVHFVAYVVLGSPALDLVGWSLLAVGMACCIRPLLSAAPVDVQPSIRQPMPSANSA